MTRAIAIISLVLTACSATAGREARHEYNQGLAALSSGDLDGASKHFLNARDNAGQDPELRYRAAFDLAFVLAQSADKKGEDVQEAMALLRQSAGWFQDAVKLRPEEEAPRQNLELILRRIQALADQLNKGKNSLEARLGRAIEDQRALRDQVRGLLSTLSASQADPLGSRDNFVALATEERALFADTGTIADLAGDELDGLNHKKEEELTEENRVRKVQLGNVDHYLQKARVDIDDCRRLLRNLDAKRALTRSASALESLKRAREQLLDPVTVLKGITQEQTQLLQHTVAVVEFNEKKLTDSGLADQALPAWLESEHLSERQAFLISRTEELIMRFRTGIESPPADPAAPVDPKHKRMLENAKEALPFLEKAQQAMVAAKDKLDVNQVEQAAEPQGQALTALYRAIEIFSDIRNLIELVYAEHLRVDDLLALKATPNEDALSPADRKAAADAALSRNLTRLARLAGLFSDELSALDSQANAQQPQTGEDPHAGEQQKQLYEAAETHRAKAEDATARLQKLVASGAKDLQSTDDEARKEIEELRRLFFSIIEHLKELHQKQTETHDRTATSEEADDSEKASLLGPISESQAQHTGTAEALAAALETQSDQAANSEDEKAAEQADRMREAAGEVRQAQSEMQAASDALAHSKQDAASMSVSLKPALEAQPKALEHLVNAIRLLEPPKEQPQNQDQQNQDKDQDQQQQGNKEQEEEVSQQQAQKRLQAIRDREAERQRKKREQERTQSEPVEKDW